MIPAKVSFQDDFLGVALAPAWNVERNVTIGGEGGRVQLTSPSATAPARLRLGEDVAQIDGLPKGVQNWRASQKLTLEARVFLNTTDCQATIGFVGAGDGQIPAADFAALYRPGGWLIQSSNVGAGGVLINQPTGFSHTPGQWVDFCLMFCGPAGNLSGTLTANGQGVLTTVFNQAALPSVPLFVEFQIWGTATNANATMWIDWVSVTQDRL